MKCYDCLQEARTDADGIGICSRCNLFVCADHAQVVRQLLHQPNGLGRSTSRLPARRLVCTTCRAAETSATSGDFAGTRQK
ncbi:MULTISPECIES: DUF2180 family protein [unclassified Streptomyces]|uniref:DUF2180 family protein n=1 Tax=unclassified Streptomyces TaxID=2593676 RepID=UPI0033CAFA30